GPQRSQPRPEWRTMRSRHLLSAALVGVGALALGATVPAAAEPPAAPSTDRPAPAPARPAEPAQVTNPITDSFSDTYADPAVIRGKDGYWYLYATSDPLTEAPSEFGLMH